MHEVVPAHIIDFDEIKQQITLSVWLRQSWYDPFLTWNARDFNNISVIRIASTKLWRPDIVLYSSVDEDGSNDPNLPATVMANGTVKYLTPYIYVCYCKVDLTYYPFDTQTCPLTFGSWAHDIRQVDLRSINNSADLSSFEDNGEWNIINVPVKRESVKYKCCPDNFTILTYSFFLSRKSDFYVINLILPYVLISLLSIMVFYLPPESGEKMNLSITVLLSLIVFNQLVFATIPPASDGTFPIIGKYFIVMIGMVALSVAMSVWILHVYHKERNCIRMPPWMRQFIFGYLSKLVGKCRPKATLPDFRNDSVSEHYYKEDTCNELKRTELIGKKVYLNERMTKAKINDDSSEPFQNGGLESPKQKRTYSRNMEESINNISSQLDFLAQLKRRKDTDMDSAREWREAAAVIDRALLIIFTIVNIFLPIGFIFAANKPFK
ncbi:neuronal acetylcholine receptor subunit alpha-2-like isoform X3 [Anneissia japonica]|uniref:neuronal acetylcholine receptor subunit alpha-2-like isoform X1 n=1 Tax=Anneissia japonica TaxID=1529436 RepID=UPI001425B371|nr:neuronal acetylcholine receptor subunit alpha-2-like isoform X1 [Anneissia japonica]XP_033108363.1 neuronal acetylcholine receptor subunit alpha-2-like isoform X2 [Anneissia japonica]XP_033108364.1 neuronal acetylcholine receptor subunit alpha-2-like isoform X3 [Anneissia japonica]